MLFKYEEEGRVKKTKMMILSAVFEEIF